MLRCPHCHAPLDRAERTFRCPAGHSFDVARQGYVALDPRPARGDTAEMVAARVAFLEAGHYAPIAEALVDAARGAAPRAAGRGDAGAAGRGGEGAARRDAPRVVVDVGAGTGYYLARLLEALPGARGVALDSSRPALRRAARAHPAITAVACDIWDALPIQDDAADLVINVFAPRNAPEMRRVLAPGGTILVVTPTERHLRELDLLAVHPNKRERIHAELDEPVSTRTVEFELDLDADAVQTLVAMGPAAHHGRRAQGPATVTASVVIEAFRG